MNVNENPNHIIMRSNVWPHLLCAQLLFDSWNVEICFAMQNTDSSPIDKSIPHSLRRNWFWAKRIAIYAPNGRQINEFEFCKILTQILGFHRICSSTTYILIWCARIWNSISDSGFRVCSFCSGIFFFFRSPSHTHILTNQYLMLSSILSSFRMC